MKYWMLSQLLNFHLNRLQVTSAHAALSWFTFSPLPQFLLESIQLAIDDDMK